MSEALTMCKEQGISEADLRKALQLVRNLLGTIHQQNINAKAARVAILYLEHVDRREAEKHISFKDQNRLREIATKLYDNAAQTLLY